MQKTEGLFDIAIATFNFNVLNDRNWEEYDVSLEEIGLLYDIKRQIDEDDNSYRDRLKEFLEDKLQRMWREVKNV